MALPLVGLFFFRIYENQLVRQTEAELIAEAAAIGAAYARDLRDAGLPPEQLGVVVGGAPDRRAAVASAGRRRRTGPTGRSSRGSIWRRLHTGAAAGGRAGHT